MPTPATTNFGNTATPGSGFFFDDFGNCQFWSALGPWPGGLITDVFCYVGGDGATPTARLCIWSNSTLKYQSGNLTLTSYGHTVGAGQWMHVTGVNVFVPPTTGSLNCGFWTNGNVIWTYEGSGSVNFQRNVSGGPTSLSSGGTEGSGALGVYVQYIPFSAHVVRAGNMTSGQPWVMRSGSFTTGTAWVMRGGIWTQGS